MEVQQNSADRRPHILQMTDELKVNTVITVKDFLREVEQLVTEKKMEYIDAVVYYCEKNNMEIETAAQLIKQNQKFKAKIRTEAETLNFLPKTSKLPI
jgi:Phage late-transcription coactivator